MFEGVPWMIGGGDAVHSADVGRQVAYDATNGATGITRPGDLRVTALPVPGPSVSIAPGGGPILNTYPGVFGQSYSVRNPEATEVPIPPTGSTSGATRFLVIRIDDPQYGGQVPADLAKGPYVRPELVPSLTGLSFPFLPLARITQPADTAAITQDMVTDLREIANPRERPVKRTFNDITAAGVKDTLTATSDYPVGQYFPQRQQKIDASIHWITVPTWATEMQISADWIGVPMHAMTGNGRVWVTYDAVVQNNPAYTTQPFRWASTDTAGRQAWAVADTVPVPPEYRGQTIAFAMRANRTGASAPDKEIWMDESSGTVLNVRFLQVAD